MLMGCFGVLLGCGRVHQTGHLVGTDGGQRLGTTVATEKEDAFHVAGVETALLDGRAIDDGSLPCQISATTLHACCN